MAGEHKTVPVQVWADVDEGIAPLVQYLNTIPGIRTHASCQGTIGEGGAEPYGPYVLVSYQSKEAESRVWNEFDCTAVAMNTVYIHPPRERINKMKRRPKMTQKQLDAYLRRERRLDALAKKNKAKAH